jgi:hypothetical protein
MTHSDFPLDMQIQCIASSRTKKKNKKQKKGNPKKKKHNFF